MISATLQIALLYGVFAFAAFDPDPSNWSGVARGWFAAVAALLAIGNMSNGRK